MFLAPEDLAELTGYSRPSKQINWLRLRAWVFEVDRDGKPPRSKPPWGKDGAQQGEKRGIA